MISENVIKHLMVMSTLYGKEFSKEAAQMIAFDLEGYSESALLAALARCRKELKFFPTVAEIIARIDDGRPGPEAAWAMLPKGEGASVVWTDEMRDAFAASRSLIGSDDIAARKAFIEVYSKQLADARVSGIPVKWSASLGHEISGRESVIKEAVDRGRLTHQEAVALLPSLEPKADQALLEGPEHWTEAPSAEVAEMIRKTIAAIGSVK
jgi:hypothetical protein